MTGGVIKLQVWVSEMSPIEATRYLLDLRSMETRHKEEQVEAYLNAMQNSKKPLHDAVKEEKGCRLARGKSWMGQAEQSIQHMCGLVELKQVRDWEKRPVEFKPYYKTLLPEYLGTHCREWPASDGNATNAEVHMLVEANSKPQDIVIYTDGSVTRDRSGWGQSSRALQGTICDYQTNIGTVWRATLDQAGRKYCTLRQKSPESHDLQSDYGDRRCHMQYSV